MCDESFFSCYSQNFLFVFKSFHIFTMIFLGEDHFAIILLRIHYVSRTCSLMFFLRVWKFSFIISLNIFLFLY